MRSTASRMQLPSGDGTAGGNYTATFTVAGALPTLASIQANVFTPRCAGCHTRRQVQPSRRLNLTSANASYAALVGVTSVQAAPLQRVTAGNPNDSYLVRKLEGGPNIVNNRMPLGGPFLDQATIDSIRLWITLRRGSVGERHETSSAKCRRRVAVRRCRAVAPGRLGGAVSRRRKRPEMCQLPRQPERRR